MSFDRLIAGVAAAALLAGTASAQTRASTAASQSSPTTSQAGGYVQQPYASAPVTGGAAQPSAAGNTMSSTPQGTTAPAATAGASAAFTPLQPVAGANIIATLKASGEFTTLLKALDATNLTSLISTHPNLTLFAPTDAAFAALPPGQLDTLMKSPNQLQAILTYHLVATSIKESDVKGHSAGKVSAADNKPLTIDGSGPSLMVNDATVLQPAVEATNGFIYPINKVLTPPAA